MNPDLDSPQSRVLPAELAAIQSNPYSQAIFENQALGIAWVDDRGCILVANATYGRFLGLLPAAMVGRCLADFIAAEDFQGLQDSWPRQGNPPGANTVVEVRHRHRDQGLVWGRLTITRVSQGSSPIPLVLVICEDMTPTKQAEQVLREHQEDLRQSEATYRTLFASNPHPLWVYDLDSLAFLEVNNAALAKYGYSREEFLAMTLGDLCPPRDLLGPYDNLNPLGEGMGRAGVGKHRKKDGTLIDVELTSHRLIFRGHRAELVLAQDISDRLQVEAKLRYSTLHDGLTDLPNRYLLTEKLQAALKQSQRQSSPRHAVLFLDLDRFKTINDNLGHLAGDQMLVILADKLKALVRETDLVARLGGDEFVIVLEDDEPIRGAIRIAERLFSELQMPLSVGDREVFLSTSIGIVLITPAYDRAADLLRDADIAMYRAKVKGKGRYEIFDAEMHASALQRLQLESDLHQALANHEFLVYFQPIVVLQTRQLMGFEALIRWQHPRRGLVDPLEFIGIAEEIGLIIALDRWVLEAVCQQLAAWDQNPALRGLTVSINLSVQDLWNIHLIDDIDRVLARYDLSGDRLTLEITESMLVNDMETTSQLINQLRQRGIQISIDDFGTGYSSLSYLHQLPADTLKIDRSFVSHMQENPKNFKIVETILSLGHHLNLKVIAEGVENQAQQKALQRLGCEFGQGHWFAPPLPAAQAAAYVTSTAKVVDGKGSIPGA
ncbi:MAG TPA: EAL domain-containing protein [Leptolyngbyaceae cyanobacterium M65_K2018_010]|nr:EAL domain-containing protein [Leptolyngbyaceae cyanobacterium M65_K2018_010]